jgi:hypothetical protein
MPPPTPGRSAALLGLLLVASACSGGGEPVEPRSGSPRQSADASAGAEPEASGSPDGGNTDGGRPAEVLRFSAPRLGGGTIDGEDFAGRDVAFWFWAPW